MEPKEYAKLREKYKKLPDWSWIERNFYFKPEDDLILVQIKRSMFEKLESVTEDIEPLLTAESIESFYERKMLTTQEKEKLFELYRNVKSALWSCNKISIEYSEKEHAGWIASAKDLWEKIKPDIARFCEKLASGWKMYKTEANYHTE